MKKREEMQEEYTWKMDDMLPSDEAWKDLFTEIESQLKTYDTFRGRLGESADIWYQCLKFDDDLSRKSELLYVYAKQKSDENTGNQKYQDYASRAQSLSFQADSMSSYIVPEILEMDDKVLSEYRKSDNGIRHFNRAIDLILDKKRHTLSSGMEELLAQSYEATQTSSHIFGMFNHADIKFPVITGSDGKDVTITHGNFIELMESSDRRVREDAFHGLYSCYKQFHNTLAAVFGANIKQAVFYAKARNYESSRAYYLADNEIPEAVYDNLISTVHEGLSYLHHYVKVRKKALHLDEIHIYDLYAPMVPDANQKIDYETARNMVLKGLEPLGREYLSVLQEGFDNRWIDVYENQGKRSGAYSWGAYGFHPYVLLNYSGTLNYVFTLAHEMGHALHSYYSDRSQSYTYAGYKIFVAEVASTCNEALLIRYLLDNTEDKQEKAYLTNHFLETFRGTLYRQTMFAEFEMTVHKLAEAGETLTADVLGKIYHQLNVDYFGSEIVVDEDIDYEWSRIPHFYTPFYVYQYATGISAAIAISSKILAHEPGALEGYQKFLRGGSSMPPIELLKLCGVDMTKPEPIKEALLVFKELLGTFESLVD